MTGILNSLSHDLQNAVRGLMILTTLAVLSILHAITWAAGARAESPADEERVGSRLGIALVGIALAREDRGYQFNFLPCARRGVIHYVRTETGRRTTFAGCDLGDGVIVDGEGELHWSGPGFEVEAGELFCGFMVGPGLPTCPSDLRWNGSLEVRVDDGSPTALSEVRIHDLVIADEGGGFPEALDFPTGVMGFASMFVALWDATILVADPTLPMKVFEPEGLGVASIPNPGGSVRALTEADVARLAWDGIAHLGRILFNETLEVQRGSHTHEFDCGTLEVTVDGMLPILRADWRECEFRGLVWDGEFRLQWNEFSTTLSDLSLEGDVEIGGAVPRIRIERIAWRAEYEPPEDLSIVGELGDGKRRRPFEYRLAVD